MIGLLPCLWMNDNADEAARFYTSLFKGSKIVNSTKYNGVGEEIHGHKAGQTMTVTFELCGDQFMMINGGPNYNINPSISFFVTCPETEEVDSLWKKLSEGGRTLISLGKYPWSEKYGWLQDKYGVGWQICHGNLEDVGAKIAVSFLFADKSEAAVKYYTSLIQPSKVVGLLKNDKGLVDHAQFVMVDRVFMAMDKQSMDQDFTAEEFNEGVSIMILCDTQEEIDYFWENLKIHGEKGQCGWIHDKFGVSWQVTPKELLKYESEMSEKSKRVTKKMLASHKFNIEELRNA